MNAKLKPEIKRKWVKALRTGGYRQGFGQMQSSDGRFCPLGVLCDLHAKETGGEWADVAAVCKDGLVFVPRCRSYLGSAKFPPAEVWEWAGVPVVDPARVDLPGDAPLTLYVRTRPTPRLARKTGVDLYRIPLAHLNDLRRANFWEIAEAIERSL